MLQTLWGFLSGAQDKKEAIDRAKISITECRTKLGRIAIGQNAGSCQQLQCFNANAIQVFKDFDLIAYINPLDAIRTLMELEKILGRHALDSFWNKAAKHIRASLSQSSPETKENVCKFILQNAHTGLLADFILSNHETFVRLLEKNPSDENLVDKFIRNAHPKTLEFFEKFQSSFELILKHRSANALSLTIKLCEACRLKKGDKATPLPDYIESARASQIERLARKIATSYFSSTPDYQEIGYCIQNMGSLKITESDGVQRVKSKAVREKSDVSKLATAKRTEADLVHLYIYMIPNEDRAKTLYVITSKKTGYAIPDDSGVMRVILISPDLSKASQAFQTLLFSKAAQREMESLVESFRESSTLYELTPLSDSLNSIYELTHLNNWYPLALQQPEPRTPE